MSASNFLNNCSLLMLLSLLLLSSLFLTIYVKKMAHTQNQSYLILCNMIKLKEL